MMERTGSAPATVTFSHGKSKAYDARTIPPSWTLRQLTAHEYFLRPSSDGLRVATPPVLSGESRAAGVRFGKILRFKLNAKKLHG